MKYFYSNIKLQEEVSLLSEINQAAEKLHEKLIKLDLKQLGISEYNQMYWGNKLNNFVGVLQLYTYLLILALVGRKVPLEEFVFVDYGGGSGVLSLLAKELGIGRVIYNDIYDVSCNDAKKISRATNIDIDDYVCGDIDILINYLRKESLSIDAISSYDVIEHIYDIEAYLRKLHFLSQTNTSYRVVFGSGANIKNPLYVRGLRKFQLDCEYKEREKKWGHKERDSLKSYLEIRKEIINKYNSSLTSQEVETIAKLTRGLMKHDIEKCLDEFKTTGRISYKPDHPTNTCDPNTGNWAEHLMETEWLENILINEGFQVKILSGYYGYTDVVYKRAIRNLLNIGIKVLRKNALFLAPYYIVYADYNV